MLLGISPTVSKKSVSISITIKKFQDSHQDLIQSRVELQHMNPTPPYHRSEGRTRAKSASRLSNLRHYNGSPIPQLSLEIAPYSPKVSTPSPASSNVSPVPNDSIPLRELLMLSSSPIKKSKPRLAERLEIVDVVEVCGVRKRCKSRNNASPRSTRRSRRKMDQELREGRELVAGEEIVVKPRKKGHGDRSKKSRSISVATPTTSDGGYLDSIGEILHDLIMWKDVAKSSFWFGCGAICFLSSCFAKGVNFSIFSFLSQVGLLFLGFSFLSNSIRQRGAAEIKHETKLKEEDILRVCRLILPAVNLTISKTRHVFSGEPAMTLQVAPILLIGAEYGHLLTVWRLCTLGFFISFTAPKLCSTCSSQLSKKVEHLKSWVLDTWRACSHKKIVVASAVTAFWNLTSIRTRMVTAFLCFVILRYHKQHPEVTVNEDAEADKQEEEQQKEKALVVVETESKK